MCLFKYNSINIKHRWMMLSQFKWNLHSFVQINNTIFLFKKLFNIAIVYFLELVKAHPTVICAVCLHLFFNNSAYILSEKTVSFCTSYDLKCLCIHYSFFLPFLCAFISIIGKRISRICRQDAS